MILIKRARYVVLSEGVKYDCLMKMKGKFNTNRKLYLIKLRS